MDEKALEWITECGESAGHKMGRVAALAAAIVLLVFSVLTLQLVFLIATVIFGVLYYWLMIHKFVEYEYCYIAEEMDISAIYNRARRKKKMDIKLAEVEYVVKGTKQEETTRYFCNKANINDIYTMVVNQSGKRTSVVMEPSPEFLQVLQMKRKLR